MKLTSFRVTDSCSITDTGEIAVAHHAIAHQERSPDDATLKRFAALCDAVNALLPRSSL